ncbi:MULTISPECIES: hypothetical protein [Okeania]|uniref:hypothetical protein n=1 Tax=Okeania TaxID=1458928 RepID=UPI0013752E64|nr:MULTISPECIES: hypothetical protein [Okeania]NET18887.1 hypothetical protein [Okeania sp. SIO1H5]NET76383.1 hypothetical protein [Okeania sp. SIO1F9]NET93404.1 hypothetical protein [Okeania sp. SIO1H2]
MKKCRGGFQGWAKIVIPSYLYLISCPVASVLYSEAKEEGRGKRKEGGRLLSKKKT